MRTFRLLMIAALAAGGLTVLAPEAGASVPGVSKTCKSLNKLQKELDKVDPSDTENFDFDELGDIGSAFHKAAKGAPSKLKSAMNSIGDVYDDMADADNLSDAVSTYGKNARKFTKALTTWGTYLATNCTGTTTTS
jgi:hypothetical protein